MTKFKKCDVKGCINTIDEHHKKIIIIQIPLVGYEKKSKYRVCGSCRDYIVSLADPNNERTKRLGDVDQCPTCGKIQVK